MYTKNKYFILFLIFFLISNTLLFAGGQQQTDSLGVKEVSVQLPSVKQTSITSTILEIIVSIFKFYGMLDRIGTLFFTAFTPILLIFSGYQIILFGNIQEVLKRRIINLIIGIIIFKLFYLFFFSAFNSILVLQSLPFKSIEIDMKKNIREKYTIQLKDINEALNTYKIFSTTVNSNPPDYIKQQINDIYYSINPYAMYDSYAMYDDSTLSLEYKYNYVKTYLNKQITYYETMKNKIQAFINDFTLFAGKDVNVKINNKNNDEYTFYFSKALDINSFFIVTNELYSDMKFDIMQPIKSILYLISNILYNIISIIFYVIYYINLLELSLVGIMGPAVSSTFIFEKFKYLFDKYIGGIIQSITKSVMFSFLYSLFFYIMNQTVLVLKDTTTADVMPSVIVIFYCMFAVFIAFQGPNFFASILAGSPNIGAAMSQAGSNLVQGIQAGSNIAGGSMAITGNIAKGAYNLAHQAAGMAGAVSGAMDFAKSNNMNPLSVGGKMMANSIGNAVNSGLNNFALKAQGFQGIDNPSMQDLDDYNFQSGLGGGPSGSGGGGGPSNTNPKPAGPFGDGIRGPLYNPYSKRGVRLQHTGFGNYYDVRKRAANDYLKTIYGGNKNNNDDNINYDCYSSYEDIYNNTRVLTDDSATVTFIGYEEPPQLPPPQLPSPNDK